VTAFAGAQTDRERLIAFYRKVYPSGPGWTPIRIAAGVSETEAARHSDHLGKATLGWIAGCLTIWSSLLGTGQFLYGRTQPALLLTAVFVVSGGVLIYVMNTLWDTRAEPSA